MFAQSLQLDHLRYLRNQPYRRGVHGRMRRLIAEAPGTVSELCVLHEADHRCCRRQPWAATYVDLLSALAADGERVVVVILEEAI